MTDEYFAFDPASSNFETPELFHKKSYNGLQDLEDYSFANFDPSVLQFQNNQSVEPLNPSQDPKNFETLSNYSTNSSTIFSSKHSPEYANYDAQDERTNKEKVPPIRKKIIHKHYEPLIDNNVIYRYEDNPNEYKKARKRIQNRESAHRVRDRKKDYYDDLKVELTAMKTENENLKVKNASLTAENNLLKQQISFLEKMLMKGQSNNEMKPEESTTAPILPFKKDDQVGSMGDQSRFFRPANPNTFKKHVAIFGIVTILICTAGMLTSSSIEPASNTTGLSEFKTKVGFALKSVEEPRQLESLVNSLVDQVNEFNGYKVFLKYAMWGAYTIYLIYVLMIANWGALFKSKKKLA